MIDDNVVKQASEHVFQIFKDKLPEWAVYHNYDHTVDVVDAADEIGQESKLSKVELEMLALAAWFRDTGITQTSNGFEEKSADLAREFLKDKAYPEDRIIRIAGCIRSTKSPEHPTDRMEEVLCDAENIYAGKKKFFKQNDLKRTEQELLSGTPVSDEEWMKSTIDALSKSNFRTKFARMNYSRQRTKNLIELQERLRAAHDENRQRDLRRQQKVEKEKVPVKGIETMLRQTANNHMHFSSIADHKASMLISTNSLMMTLVVALVGRGLFERDASLNPIYPIYVMVPIIILMVTALITIVFAIISTMPKITSGTFTEEDIRQKRANLLFFGNFHRMDFEQFDQGMRDMMQDGDYIYGTLIKDIYHLGKVLARKFLFLRVSYNVFMIGLITTILSSVVLYWLSS